MPSARDGYNPVATVQPNGGMPGNYLSVRPNADQFGAGVAKATQGLGNTIGQAGNVMTQIGIQEQGMINEAIATDAETLMNKAYGEIKGKYQSLKGLAAVTAHDKAVEDVVNTRKKIAATIPNPAAARAFNLLSARQEGFLIREFGEYKAGQIKEADRTSAEASAQVSLDTASDPSIANNDQAFDENLGNIDFQVGRIVNNLGYMTGASQDPATGAVTFPATEEGRQAEAVYKKYLNHYQASAWTNRINTLAFDPQSGSVEKAVDVLTKNKDRIPSAAYAALSAKLAPAYRNEQARQGADRLIGSVDSDYDNGIATGSLEGMKTIVSGLLPGIEITSGFRTPEDNVRVDGVPNSRHLTGNALDFVLPEGMTFEEVKERLDRGGFKYKELKNYVNDPNHGDHVHVAWESREGTPVSNAAQAYTSKANYYRQNYTKILDRAEQEAERLHPGDSVFRDTYVSRVEQRISKEIQQQGLMTRANQDKILGIIQGSNKEAPVVNIDQLDLSPDPAVRSAIADWRREDPYADVKMNNLILANTRGKSQNYGTDFYKYYSDVTSGKIDDPSDLLTAVGAGNAPLSNTGYGILKKIIDDRSTPEGVAWQDQTKKFLDGVRLGMTSRVPGVKLPALDANFEKSLMTLIPRIEAGKAQGKTPAELFDPASSDYVGRDIKMPTRAEMSAAKAQAAATRRFNQTEGEKAAVVYKDLPSLIKGYREGKLSRSEFDRIAIEKKWAVAPKPQATSTVETPPSVPLPQ